MEIETIEQDGLVYVFACEVTGLKNKSSLAFNISLPERSGYDGFLVRADDGKLYAYVNSCPHTGAPLNWTPDQFLTASGHYIQCSIHGAKFQIKDGECFVGPCAGRFLKALRVVEKDGSSYVAVMDI